MTQKDYVPQDVFAGDAPPQQSPRVIIAPGRYIQGDGVLDHLGHYLSLINCTRPALLITEGGLKRVGDRVLQSLQQVQIEPLTLLFEGECSDEEVERHVKRLRSRPTDALIAVGGGKCLDTGKCVASSIAVPVIICPTLASTDAPCSAVSVMYTPDGAFERPWFFTESPAIVVVDTGVIVRAPARHFVAGMGDAMSTYYETRTCFLNPEARNMVGARPTTAAMAIAELGAKLLFENGVRALEAVRKSEVNEAVENVVEANTLLSGIGFESGGLAASHGVAQVFPAIPFLHEQYLHGEMVAIGAVGLAPSVPGLNPGRLIIYERREGTWTVREVLTAPTAPDTAEFPLSVDIEDSVAITGAPLLDSEGEYGSLIIYELPPE